ncbi:protein adenylyltransferase Fic [Finegoldia magna]|uniref:protein adenylyltransferase Fic n=1 Tax=Finegoldia magna TaxID=1260 RepID=UPI00399B0C36
MGFILFIFFYSFRKIRFFINTLLLSKNKDIDLWDKGIINNFEVGTYRGLKQIHKYLYRDIYEFAGKTRDVNLAKGNLRFTNILYLENNLAIIEKMPEGSFDEIIEKYVEMNVAHPFREGNGRATRIWLDLMLKKNLNVCVDWAMVDRADYLSAMERSPVNSLEIKHLLKNALTDRVDDRGVYLRGIQQSYVYEDLDRYDIEDIEE